MTTSYSLTDAKTALETYGANFDLWPDQALAAFVQNNAALQTAHREAKQLDQALSAHEVPNVSDLVKSRIVKFAAQTPQDIAAPAPAKQSHALSFATPQRWMRIAALFLISAVIGGALYMQTPNEPSDVVLSAAIDEETDAWLTAANEMNMVDVFLWVETEDVAS